MPRFITRSRPDGPVVTARPITLEELQARVYAAGAEAVRRFREGLPSNSASPRPPSSDDDEDE